ncbi:MAG: fumarate hydratase [Veillonella sp.]|nr:fumarate hydratase [Veillonella sp.]
MREIQVSEITKTVRQMCMDAAYHLPKDIYEGLKKGRETEESPVGCIVLDQIIKNAEIADAEDRPYCQDTGMTDLKEAINEGVAQGYVEGYLRKSVVAEPLFNRKNTQNNTPAIIYIDIVPGDKVEINVELKGFGSENKSDVAMLVPADGVEGVKNAVLEIVKHAGPNPCPPIVLGVGIGGTMDQAAVMSKKALLRDISTPHKDPEYAKLEEEILEMVNKTGIGPQLGGTTTCIGVNIEWGATHIAGLPVAVTIMCHAARHKHVVL